MSKPVLLQRWVVDTMSHVGLLAAVNQKIYTTWTPLRCAIVFTACIIAILLLGITEKDVWKSLSICQIAGNNAVAAIWLTALNGSYFGAMLSLFTANRVPTNQENLALSGNFVNLEKSGNSQGIWDMVREIFYDMSYFSRLADWCFDFCMYYERWISLNGRWYWRHTKIC